MTISLSIHSITAQVLAQVALRSHLKDYYPPMLEQEHSESLPALARSAYSCVCIEISSWLMDCNADEMDGDLLQLDFHDDININPIALRLLIEHAISSRLLSEIYTGTDNDAAERFESDFCATLQRLRSCLKPKYNPGDRILPYPI